MARQTESRGGRSLAIPITTARGREVRRNNVVGKGGAHMRASNQRGVDARLKDRLDGLERRLKGTAGKGQVSCGGLVLAALMMLFKLW